MPRREDEYRYLGRSHPHYCTCVECTQRRLRSPSDSGRSPDRPRSAGGGRRAAGSSSRNTANGVIGWLIALSVVIATGALGCGLAAGELDLSPPAGPPPEAPAAAVRQLTPAPTTAAMPPTPSSRANVDNVPIPDAATPVVPLRTPRAVAEPATSPATGFQSSSMIGKVQLSVSYRVRYYYVDGTDAKEIFADVEAKGPDSDAETVGHFTSGLTEHNGNFEVQTLRDRASCWLDSGAIHQELVVTLPRHLNPASLSPVIRRRISEFERRVADHEQTHVDIHIEEMRATAGGLDQLATHATCEALTKKIDEVWDEGARIDDQRQEAFHQEEDRTSRALRAPIEREIELNRQQTSLLVQTADSLSLELDNLRAKIEETEKLIRPFKEGMDAIEARYPDLTLPKEAFDEYETLMGEWDLRNDARNVLVDEVNQRVALHNDAIEAHNSLAEERNRLTDILNWLP